MQIKPCTLREPARPWAFWGAWKTSRSWLFEPRALFSSPVERLEEALRARRDRVLLFGRPVDLQPYLERAAERVAPVALEALRQSLRKESGSVDAVLLTGGGAALYEPVAQNLFPSNPIFVPDQPELANARGFYHFGAE